MIRTLTFLLSLILLLPGTLLAEQDSYEASLLQALTDIQQLNHDQALSQTRALIKQYPTSKVGQLLYADLLLAKAGVVSEIGAGIRAQPALNDLTFELKQRLYSKKLPAHQGLLPENIITLADNQPYVLLFDQSHSRLYVYHNEQGTPVLEKDYYFSIGLKGSGKQKRGDQKTPIGVYHVTRYIDGKELPDLYGKGAFPVSYPNVWDKRMNRTGGGIWLHGTPSYTYSRAPWSSNGCMVVSNPDFVDIEKYINPDLHTPVIVAKEVNWISQEKWQSKQKNLLQSLSRWLRDRESNQHHQYISHYSRTGFTADGRDFQDWEGHQRWINRNKDEINIEYRNLNIFQYPGEENLVLMQYDQVYQSNILNIDSAKELYWKRQQNDWKIVYEGIREFKQQKDRLVENQ